MNLEKHIRLFDKNSSNTNESIFGDHSGLLYWDEQKPAYYEVYKELTNNFWIPNEVSLSSDERDWNQNMTDLEKNLYKRAISQLVLLDSVSTAIDGQFSAYIKNPAIKAVMSYIASQEAIHNESYTYISSSFMSRQETMAVFEIPKTDKLILGSSELILDEFENFISNPSKLSMVKALIAMAALEGIRFTNGFTPFYLFNRNNKMLGTGKIIQFIQRDEIQHSYFQTILVRDIVTEIELENPGSTIELEEWIYSFFEKVVVSEKELASDLYLGYPSININEVKGYIEWRANIILQNLGMEKKFESKSNPMIWINAFDAANINNDRVDFFETRVNNYSKVTDDKNGWGAL